MSLNKILLIVLGVLAVAGIAVAVYYYREYRHLKDNPSAASEEEVKAIVDEIGNFMQLPGDETPSLATILDKEKIKDQPFFKNAENGDKLLAYTKAMKAILYRPSAKKVIEVAPLNIDQPAAQQDASTLKVAYYNGSSEAGKAAETEKKVRAQYAEYSTVEVKDAAKKDYESNLVIDVSGNHASEAAALATLIGGTVGELPKDEIKPAADILIISGK